jgi:MipA family protein
MKTVACLFGLFASAAIALPAVAQDGNIATDLPGELPREAPLDPFAETVYSGDYLSIGLGAAYNPSYSGSDDYVVSVLPIVQASFNGIDVSPRAGGVTIDFIDDPARGPGLDAGMAARLRTARATQLKDPVVRTLGKLDRAIEVGPAIGLSLPGVLNPYDSLSFGVDALWDVAGAHDGMTVNPSISYFTPLSEGIAASLSFSAEYADVDFHDYYFSVNAAQNATTGGVLPVFVPDGGGFTQAGVNLLLGIDLNGNLADGGLGLVLLGGYARMLGDAKRTPFTSVVGDADQFLGAVGIGYTF